MFNMKWDGLAIGLCLAVASTAAAQEVTLSAPGAKDGLEDFLSSASIAVSLAEEGDKSPQDFIAAARADYRSLLTALYAKGYYAGAISIRVDGREASAIPPLDAPGRIGRIAITVDPGPRFTFGAARIAPLPEGARPPDAFASGEVALSDTIRQAAVEGVEAWRAAGHAKADVADQQIVARHAAEQLDASVTLSPGPRLTFGPLTVVGNEDVRTAALLNIAGLPVGETFSPEELARAAKRLRDTGAFDSVAMTEAEAVGPNNTLPITVTVAEAKPRRIGAGIELSSVEGLKLSTYWMHRNAFGAAERFRIEGEVAGLGGGTGGIDYRIATSLTIPAIYGPDLDIVAKAGISREDEPDYLLDKAEVELGLSRAITDDLTVSGGVGYLAAREETAAGTREYTLVTLPLQATFDRRDNPTDARNGYYVDVRATPFYGLNGSDSGGRLYVDTRGYVSFGTDDRITLAARGQIGSVIGADRDQAPVDFLFFSGGSGSVRGQPYKALGIDEVIGGEEVTTGGASFAGAQLEARYGITESIGLVGFYDVGYVGATETPLEDGAWHSGLGIGARYNTGIGPIRFDIGTPANGDDAFGSVQVYIGIGQAF